MKLFKFVLGSNVLLLSMTSVGCSQPEPTVIARSVSPDGKLEVAMFHDVPGSIMDDTMLFTINKPNAVYGRGALAASIKRARQLHFYWTSDGLLVLSVRNLQGWVYADEGATGGFPGFVLCGASVQQCESMFVPQISNNGIKLTEYHSEESEPFESDE